MEFRNLQVMWAGIADHHPSRRRRADLRRAVRARQRGLNLDRGDRDPPHEHD
jgi:hypothetical protein